MYFTQMLLNIFEEALFARYLSKTSMVLYVLSLVIMSDADDDRFAESNADSDDTKELIASSLSKKKEATTKAPPKKQASDSDDEEEGWFDLTATRP